jgi:hypothetical protein
VTDERKAATTAVKRSGSSKKGSWPERSRISRRPFGDDARELLTMACDLHHPAVVPP